MREKILQSKFDGFILAFAFALANLRATMFVYLYPDVSRLFGPAWVEIGCWLLIFLAACVVLIRDRQVGNYLFAWRQNWLVGFFVLLAFISTFWSLGFIVTLFRSFELLFATLIAAYLGMRYRPKQMLEFLFWFGAVLIMISIAIVFAAPQTGTMYWAPFYGAWRGIYWHRNHLASISALLSLVFLFRMLIAWENHNIKGLLDGVYYVLSLVVLFYAKSATGYILFVVLHLIVFCTWLWLKTFHRLQKRHYYILLGAFGLASILTLSNLSMVFGLFNRDATLTGRVNLWNHLLKNIVSQRPWWGHGFGAVWTFDPFREEIRRLVGWASQPLIADNGFLDILLHVGVIGLLIFAGILILAAVRSFRSALSHKTLAGFFPLLLIFYGVFANITFSLFAETEVFVWFLIVAALFMATPLLPDAAAQ